MCIRTRTQLPSHTHIHANKPSIYKQNRIPQSPLSYTCLYEYLCMHITQRLNIVFQLASITWTSFFFNCLPQSAIFYNKKCQACENIICLIDKNTFFKIISNLSFASSSSHLSPFVHFCFRLHSSFRMPLSVVRLLIQQTFLIKKKVFQFLSHTKKRKRKKTFDSILEGAHVQKCSVETSRTWR